MKKLIAVLLLIFISVSFAACVSPSETVERSPSIPTETEDEKLTGGAKAIIFVHGILGGQLYNEETGQNIWDFFSGDIEDCQNYDNLKEALRNEIENNSVNFIKLIADVMDGNSESILVQMLSDEDGDPLYPTTTGYPDSDTRRRYGGFSAYKGAVTNLEEKYSKDYVVKFFNYNWLVDLKQAAEKLEEFINENNFTEVVLISHSMGGLVTSRYLAKAENRRRIDKNIILFSPLYGSYYAIQALENENYFTGYLDFIKGLVDILPLGNIGVAISNIVDRIKQSELSDLISNSTTVYQLLPSPELLELFPDAVRMDGESVSSKDLYAFYEGRPWALKEDGDVKGTLEKYYRLREDLYVDVNGEKVFASELVDSYYVGGINHSTAYSAYYDDKLSLIDTRDGDGTVLFYSATLGKEADGEHVFAVDCGHSAATDLEGELQRIVFSIIDKDLK